VEYAVDSDLRSIQLTDLEVPLLPVTTNLSLLRAEVVREGTVGFGVRLSCSAPGVFGSTSANQSVYVDGAVTDNVPVLLAQAMGADLVIATNALPPAAGAGSGGFGLLKRLRDASVSFDLVLHLAGERTSTSRTIVYSAAPAATPLLSTFDFAASARIVDETRTRDARFQATIEASVVAFRELSRPRALAGERRAWRYGSGATR
jgi:predicted acylesterase/phospholipase RssA